MSKSRKLTLITVIVFFLLLLNCCLPFSTFDNQSNKIVKSSESRDYWPTQEWLTATPESKGMDSTKLDHMLKVIELQAYKLESILIVRNGYIVFEEYPTEEYDYARKHQLLSVTKSFTSTLIGIALAKGYIKSVDEKMIDFFPERVIANLDARKRAITLEHLLTMSVGIEWNELEYHYLDNRNTLKQMWMSGDPVQYFLDQPMDHEPGELFEYNSGASIMLGAIFERATGKSVNDFAKEYLFDLIGIYDYGWELIYDGGGLYHTEKGLWLTPRNMARLGYLFLNNGTWDGQEVVSKEWIFEATKTRFYQDLDHGYGYQWWTLPNEHIYYASGSYEQNIYVCPDEDLVVIFTGEIDADHLPSERLLLSHILPATTISEEVSIDNNDTDTEHPGEDGKYIVMIMIITFSVSLLSIFAVIAFYKAYSEN